MPYCTNCGAELKSEARFCPKCGKRVVEKIEQNHKFFTEKDNMGTRQDTTSKAMAYWSARRSSPKKDPFVIYTFDAKKDARQALLELPCIYVAEDSQKLICTEVLEFGYYPIDYGMAGVKYEAIVCGDELTYELWEQAKSSFSKYGGRRKNDLEPKRHTTPISKVNGAQPNKVVFVREDHNQISGVTMIYRIYNGPDADSAKAFLKENPVTRQYYYIIVETPEGNYCCDINGMYKE